jgi:uncharacterized protein DUF2461
MAFTGWPEQAFEVLLQLEGEPTEDQRERLRREREQLVRAPMIELLNDVADADERYQDFSVWGYGKTAWWWQHQIGIVRQRGQHEMGLRFDLDGLHIGGIWANRQLVAFRAAIDDAESGSALADILKDLEGKRYEVTGDVMSRVPRGFSADHPRIELLRHRSLRATRPLWDEDCLHSAAAVPEVLEVFAELRPLMAWLGEYVPGR